MTTLSCTLRTAELAPSEWTIIASVSEPEKMETDTWIEISYDKDIDSPRG